MTQNENLSQKLEKEAQIQITASEEKCQTTYLHTRRLFD